MKFGLPTKSSLYRGTQIKMITKYLQNRVYLATLPIVSECGKLELLTPLPATGFLELWSSLRPFEFELFF
jgi:hypothetical protein